MAHVIAVGNEKGGSGKSTISFHTAVALEYSGRSVGILDLDLRQQSLFRYAQNRLDWCERNRLRLPSPSIGKLFGPADTKRGGYPDVSEEAFLDRLAQMEGESDFVLIDCPGAHTPLSEIAHCKADTLITPMSDSFIDFDLLAKVNPETGRIESPSVYSQMVWAARQRRAGAGMPPTDWVVARNRLTEENRMHGREVSSSLQNLSRRIGFRIAPGLGERVIFRELFLLGLTILDVGSSDAQKLTMSDIAARQELRAFIKALSLPGVAISF